MTLLHIPGSHKNRTCVRKLPITLLTCTYRSRPINVHFHCVNLLFCFYHVLIQMTMLMLMLMLMLMVMMINDDYHYDHYFDDLYSTSSRLLLRSAPDPSSDKEGSFKVAIEHVRGILGSRRRYEGSSFQNTEPATEKAAWQK